MSIEFYQQNAQSFFDNTAHIDTTELHERFTSLMPPNAKILDAGCGSGRDTKRFLEMGYEVDAFDASEEMAKLATSHTGIQVETCQFSDVNEYEAYDGIWACASLLHVPERDLSKTLIKLTNALKLNGHLYASFKFGHGEFEREGRRFTNMNKRALANLLLPLPELSIERLWLSDDARPDVFDQWFNVILKKTG